MKVRIDYTTREVVVLEGGTVFQHSHNIDYIQIAIDQYTPGLVYKLNFTDPSGSKNLSRYLEFIGQSGDLYYFKLPLNSTNTAYANVLTDRVPKSSNDLTLTGICTLPTLNAPPSRSISSEEVKPSLI